MGTIWIPGGSGGADTSVVTATAEDVLAPKVIVGPDGEPIDGTMVNNGAVSHSLPINGTYPIPKGYHDGNGKVSQSIPVQGGSNNIPTTAQKLIVSAGRYVNQNIYIAGDPNFTEANIKKGVTIWGKRGTHSGIVADTNDLYNNGVNSANFTLSPAGKFIDGAIYMRSSQSYSYLQLTASKVYPFAGYNYLNIDIWLKDNKSGSPTNYIKLYNGTNVMSRWDYNSGYFPQGRHTLQLNVTNIEINFAPLIEIDRGFWWWTDCYIYRIWLS